MTQAPNKPQVVIDPAIKAQLAKMKGQFNAAKENPTAFQDGPISVPDGKYMTRLANAELGMSNASGRLQIKWEYVIEEGEYTGNTLRDYDGLDRPENLPFLLRKVRRLGYDISQIDFDTELPQLLADITAKNFQVQVQAKTTRNKSTGAEFQNVYINQVYMEGSEATSDEPTEEEATEKPIIGISSKVKFLDPDGTEKLGLVKSVNGDTIKVTSGGKMYELDVTEVTLV